MPIIAKTDSNIDFEPAPEGVHQAVCVDVVDLGELTLTWQGVAKKKHMVQVAWQIAEDRDDGKPYLVFKRYRLSLHAKSTLRKDLESWRGKKFTPDEEAGFDVERLVGVNCLLNIQHNTPAGGDRTYANIISIMPLVKGMPKMEVRDFTRKKDRRDGGEEPPVEDVEDDADSLDAVAF